MADLPKSLFIFGAGGHGKVVAEVAQACSWTVGGFIDDNLPAGSQVNRIEVVDRSLESFAGQKEHAVFIALGDDRLRHHMGRAQRQSGCHTPILIHPSAVVSPSASIGEGTVIMAGAVIQSCATLGTDCIVNTAATVDHDCKIADAAQICPGAHLAGNVSVGERAFIGTGANIVPGIAVGDEACVAAGATVIANVDARSLVAGTPAVEKNRRGG